MPEPRRGYFLPEAPGDPLGPRDEEPDRHRREAAQREASEHTKHEVRTRVCRVQRDPRVAPPDLQPGDRPPRQAALGKCTRWQP